MNQLDAVVQIIMPIVALWELLVALFALSMDRRARANRYVAAILVLMALNGYTQSRLAGAETLAQTKPWTYIMAATTMSMSAGTCLVAFALLRPDAWPQEKRKRRLWQLAHVMAFAPLFLTLNDLLLGTNLFYTGLEQEAYAGGFLSDADYLQGIMAGPVSFILRYVMSFFALGLLIHTIWRDPQSTPLLRRRARWLLVIQVLSPIMAVGLSSFVGLLPATASIGILMASVYAIMLLRGMVSDRILSSRLANVSLVVKLYVSLSISVLGLLTVGGITTFSSLSNQALVSHTLNRQRHLTDLASDINSNLFDIQNKVFEFYNTWSLSGFERTYQGGFQQAQNVYESALAEKRTNIDADIFEIRQLNPEPETVADLERITRSINTYELTILEMSDNMERLGFYDSGLTGQVRETLDELYAMLDRPGLEVLQGTLVQLDLQTKDFFIRSDLASARQVSELTRQQRAQIVPFHEFLLSSADKSSLTTLLDEFDRLFLAASSEHLQLQGNRENLVNQSNLTNVLVSQLFLEQQSAFDVAAEQLQQEQFNTTVTISSIVVLTMLVSVGFVYFIVGQITAPVRELGETANRLGAGELTVRALVRGSDEIGVTATAFNLMAERLQELLAGLEKQVAIRTLDLERYSSYLEASTEIGRVASSILDADELTQRVVEQIRERFELYYVGLFLQDESGEWAVLKAGTGEAGQALLARQYRLHLGGGSIVGWCIEKSQPRIALADEAAVAHLSVPELPDSRSEAAIPLRVLDQARGALSVHHRDPEAFGQDTMVALQMVADQVAVALENATLFTESRLALEVAQRSYGELSRRAWLDLLRAGPELGFRSDERSVTRIADDAWQATAQEPSDAEKRHLLSIPIKVGDDVIGALDTYKPDVAGHWTREEIDMMQEITSQLALALDSARLHQSTRTRAHREQLTAQITARMRETLDVETVLRTAVEEIYEALDLSELTIYLSPERTES